ncbi:MAG: hypothetical protein R2705_07305 [Ilumatobacteraceae bacterium]
MGTDLPTADGEQPMGAPLGRPWSGVELRGVVDDDGRTSWPWRIGSFGCRLPTLMVTGVGLITEARLQPRSNGSPSWYFTGDLVTVDGAGAIATRVDATTR